MSVFVHIEKKYKIPKSISVPLILLIITGTVGFIWAHISPPAVEKQINETNASVKALIQKDSTKTLQFELIKSDVKTVLNNQCDLKESNDASFERMEKRLDALFSICRNSRNYSVVNK